MVIIFIEQTHGLKHIVKTSLWSICKQSVCVMLLMPTYDRIHTLRADDVTGHLAGQLNQQLGHLPQGTC